MIQVQPHTHTQKFHSRPRGAPRRAPINHGIVSLARHHTELFLEVIGVHHLCLARRQAHARLTVCNLVPCAAVGVGAADQSDPTPTVCRSLERMRQTVRSADGSTCIEGPHILIDPTSSQWVVHPSIPVEASRAVTGQRRPHPPPTRNTHARARAHTHTHVFE